MSVSEITQIVQASETWWKGGSDQRKNPRVTHFKNVSYDNGISEGFALLERF